MSDKTMRAMTWPAVAVAGIVIAALTIGVLTDAVPLDTALRIGAAAIGLGG